MNVNMDLIVQSVNTLLDNAAKYTSEGSEIYLGVQQGDGAEGQGEAKAMTGAVKVQPGYAVIYVRDTGPGIPDEERREIFKRFYRGISARGKSGSGLGLSIAQWIAQKHGGRVEVNSVVERAQCSHFLSLLWSKTVSKENITGRITVYNHMITKADKDGIILNALMIIRTPAKRR